MDIIPKDFVILPGGSDIHPFIYGKKNYKSHTFGDDISQIDRQHIAMYTNAVKAGKPIFGICRGQQLVAALNGLTLIQDMKHPSEHYINIRNLENNLFDREIKTNSAHHQLVWTDNNLEDDDYKIYGYSNISTHHHYQEDEEVTCVIEPEIMWFPKVKALTVQFHPEWMIYNGLYNNCLLYIKELINKLY